MFLGSFSYFRCLGRFSCFGCFGCVPGLLVFMQVGHADILQVLELLVDVNFSCARSAGFLQTWHMVICWFSVLGLQIYRIY